MTVSLRRMSAGAGYRYLLRSVAAGDGNRKLSSPLTRYYSEVGTPPGRWMGSGLAALGNGRIKAGMQVSEEQLALLIGLGRDPVTGDQLGRAYPEHEPLRDRIAQRVARLDPSLAGEERTAALARIETDETIAGARHAVAGYDLTFSVPKSVSVLWGLADAPVQERIVAAHHAAMADVLNFFEREVAATRAGFADLDGAVAQVEVAGVAAVAYDHYDSRAGDPQLHTHLVVSNKVHTVRDGRWRSLDGRPVHSSVTGLSAHYDALLMDRLSRELGVEWELRDRGMDRNPQWEIAGISDDLVREFSSRSRAIDLEKDRLIDAYIVGHGRRPSEKKIVELRAQATLATRPPKKLQSLADLTVGWRRRTTQRIGIRHDGWVRSLLDTPPPEPLTADDVPWPAVQEVASQVVDEVGVKRATWTHWNLMAEASRQTKDIRFATTADREAAVALIVQAAERKSVTLTPPELVTSPAAFRRPDGTSVFRPRHSTKYSSNVILDAEARLLERADTIIGPRIDQTVLHRVPRSTRISPEQARAMAAIASSGRCLDLLVGPAGAGKTTTMRALRHAWTAQQGPGSVVGLAPSATAAQALADDLGISCDNTAKWLHEHGRGNTTLRAGQLVIIDEATLADTRTLDRITAIAQRARAKVLLVGDPHQLQSVDAGGAFALLVDRRPHVPELKQLHRFTHDWEKTATLALRAGDVEVISTYARQQRIREGATDAMTDAAYAAWRDDIARGRASLLVAESSHAVRALNERARAERILQDGAASGREIELAGGARASAGDLVITRRNDRSLETAPQEWVKNGDRWRITAKRRDGSVVVQRVDGTRGSVTLPPAYVINYLDLGYAVTAHRAQGITVDAAHVVVTPSTTRENLYVSMTRGRDSNIAYVALDQPDDSHTEPPHGEVTARTVLHAVLNHIGDSLSATQTVEAEDAEYSSIARLAAEYETIAADAQHDRFVDLLRRSGLTPDQLSTVVASAAFGPLAAALRRAEAHHHDLERLAQTVVGQHGLDDADDIAAILRYRIDRARSPRLVRRLEPRLIAGLLPQALGPMSPEDRLALAQRKRYIEARADALVDIARASQEPWIQRFDAQPKTEAHPAWTAAAVAGAAYRDRHGIASHTPLGHGTDSEVAAQDRVFARAAVRRYSRACAEAQHQPRPRSIPRDARSIDFGQSL